MIPVADLAALYDLGDGFTVQATVNGVTRPVHWRQGDADAMGGDRLVREYEMRYRVADFPSLARGATVTLAAQAYRVLEVRQLPSGLEAQARLGKV